MLTNMPFVVSPKGLLRFNLMFCDKNQNIPAKEKCVIIFVSNIYMTFFWEKNICG